MLLLLLLLSNADVAEPQRLLGLKNQTSCMCNVDSGQWSFPVVKFEAVLKDVDTCETSMNRLQEKVVLSQLRLPQIQDQISNMTARLQPYLYLHDQGLYSTLSLRLLSSELSVLETNVGSIHDKFNTAQTLQLSKEVGKLRKKVDSMQRMDVINMKMFKEKLRYLKNSAESCRSIPSDFTGHHMYCLKGLIKSISEPVVTKVSPYGKSYISGSWGKQAQRDGVDQPDTYWVLSLLNSNIWGNTFRVYPTYEDFMQSRNQRDFTLAPSQTHTNAVEGPSAVLYGDALFYHCYRSADICRYDLKTNNVKRVTLPGTGVGFNNKFPYCYYDCRANSDVDVEVDETGLWAIYATVGNHGNLVVSRLVWDDRAESLNVSQTWETRVFKKAVTSAFMVCGVMYATRFVDDGLEEVFYAFDTATGREDNTLALPLEKVVKGVASVSYNPVDKQIYMYNDGYLMAYQASF
uniref:Olfactomedin-like domain-containing protein n=2 Tax=Sphaeramia orbicularis TaxID=375764 RepID=A0A672Z013_9TELE